MLSNYSSYKNKAIGLRKSGKTYGEIRHTLKINIPKSTLSYWCRKVKLSPVYRNRISKIISEGGNKGRLIAIEINKAKRERYLKDIFLKNRYLLRKLKDKDTSKIALSMLFWAEGSKSTKGSVAFGNSDPGMIKVFLKLLKRCYGINKNKLTIRVQCRADQNIPILEKFWIEVTRVDPSMLRKANVDPRTIGKPSLKREYKGVCRIDYFSGHIYNELMTICKIFGEN